MERALVRNCRSGEVIECYLAGGSRRQWDMSFILGIHCPCAQKKGGRSFGVFLRGVMSIHTMWYIMIGERSVKMNAIGFNPYHQPAYFSAHNRQDHTKQLPLRLANSVDNSLQFPAVIKKLVSSRSPHPALNMPKEPSDEDQPSNAEDVAPPTPESRQHCSNPRARQLEEPKCEGKDQVTEGEEKMLPNLPMDRWHRFTLCEMSTGTHQV